MGCCWKINRTAFTFTYDSSLPAGSALWIMKCRDILKAKCLILVRSQDISVLALSSDFKETLKSIYLATRVNLSQFSLVNVH